MPRFALPSAAVLAAGLALLPAGQAQVSPLAGVLDQFTAANVPAQGAAEVATPPDWPLPTGAPSWPGRGLAQHAMLYAGEGYNKILLVNGGRVVWSYATGPGGEIDDVWMLTNGDVLFTRQFHVEEVNPRKVVVWHYDPPAGTEIHSCQPIGLDKVLVVQNGLPPKLIVFNKRTGGIELEHALPVPNLTDQKTVHAQFRRVRMTAAGTFLLPYLTLGKVVEFDANFNPIWTYPIRSPWAAVRLQNGDTLITAEHDQLVREVNPGGATVWEFRRSDWPAGLIPHNLQTADRLANGDTVIFSSTQGTKKDERPGIIQVVEVTPDKKVAWVLQDWKDLGPATTAQFLDEPGIPERPGELQR
jgi:hypothetical protein